MWLCSELANYMQIHVKFQHQRAPANIYSAFEYPPINKYIHFKCASFFVSLSHRGLKVLTQWLQLLFLLLSTLSWQLNKSLETVFFHIDCTDEAILFIKPNAQTGMPDRKLFSHNIFQKFCWFSLRVYGFAIGSFDGVSDLIVFQMSEHTSCALCNPSKSSMCFMKRKTNSRGNFHFLANAKGHHRKL